MREFACKNSMLKGQYRQTLFWPELWAPCGGGKGVYKTPKKCFHEILSWSCLFPFFFFFGHSSEKNFPGLHISPVGLGNRPWRPGPAAGRGQEEGSALPTKCCSQGSLYRSRGALSLLVWLCTSCGCPSLGHPALGTPEAGPEARTLAPGIFGG